MSCDPKHILYHACNSTLQINLHIKFEVPSFTLSKDMIALKIKKASMTVTMPSLGVISHHKANTSYGLQV